MKIFLTIIVIALVLLGGGAVLLGPYTGDLLPGFSSEPTGTEVRMQPAEVRDLTETIPALGVIEPNTNVDISATIVAEIIALPFREGDEVKKGDVVVRLDDRDMQARLASARASLESAEASLEASKANRDRAKSSLDEQLARREGLLSNLEYAERDLRRKQELFESGDIPRSDLDVAAERVDDIRTQLAASTTLISGAESSLASAEAQVLQAVAAVKRAQADIKLAEEALRDTTIASPINGKVTKLNAEVGERVVTGTMNNPGTVIMTIADLSRMKMVARVDESDIEPVAEGQIVKVYIRSYPDEVFTGVVDQIALERTPEPDGTGYFETEILLRLDGREIKSGGSANAEIEVATHTDVVVPSQSVVDRDVDTLPFDVIEGSDVVDRSKQVIRVVYRVIDNKAVATPVRIGASDSTHTLVEAGLEPGDMVITGPYKVLDTIEHGERVLDVRRKRNEAAGAGEDGAEPDAGGGGEASP